MEWLNDAGLSKNETKIYEALVKFGKLGAGDVSGRSGVPYSRVYDVLNSLIEKGLVEVVPEKSKKFIAGDPENLLKIIENKEKSLASTKDKIKELKKFYEVEEKQPIIMGVGKQAFYKILDEMEKSKKTDYSIRWSSEYRDEWVKNLKKRKSMGIKTATLARVDNETRKDVNKWLKIEKNIKVFHNDGVAMSIKDNEVLISLIKSNITLLVRDKPFVDVMQRLFLAAYELSPSPK